MLHSLHEGEPDLPGMAVTRAASVLGVDRRFVEFLVGEADEDGTFAREHGCVRLASHRARLVAEDAALAAKVESAYRSGGYTPPPDVDEVVERSRAKEARVLRVCAFLVHEGVLVETAKRLFFHAQAVAGAREFVLRALGEKGALETGELKAFMISSGGTSRKYLIPLLEHFDRTGLTSREGDVRRPGWRARGSQ
jgi:selenocysteine-specific elongation factor